MSINVQKHDIKTINASDCATSHSTDIVTPDNGFFLFTAGPRDKGVGVGPSGSVVVRLPPKNKKNKTLKWCGPACKTAEGQRQVLRRCAVVEDHIWYSRYEYTYTHTLYRHRCGFVSVHENTIWKHPKCLLNTTSLGKVFCCCCSFLCLFFSHPPSLATVF